MYKATIAILFTAMFLVGCNEQDVEKTGTNFEYIPLKEYKYSPADIKPGTKLQLLDFSGGERNPADTIYYYQFIAINTTTGDTIKILAPLITVPSEIKGDPKIYTTPTLYNPDKGLTTATYSIMDSSQNWALLSPDMLMDTSTNARHSLNKISANKLIVFNRTQPIFKNSTYKVVVGVLNFDGIPW